MNTFQDACDAYREFDADQTGKVMFTGRGSLEGLTLSNLSGATILYVKVYDKATAPTEADTPKLTYVTTAQSSREINLRSTGIRFVNGVSVRCTTGIGDADTGAPAANVMFVQAYIRKLPQVA